MVEARKNLQAAAGKLEGSKEIPSETLKELKALAPMIEGLRIQIAAQKLSARLESKSPVRVTVARGVEAPETLEVNPGTPWEGQAEGKLRFDLQNLSVEVASGTGDVQSLFAQLEEKASRQQEILDGLNLSDLAAVEVVDRDHEQRVSDEKSARKIYDSALQGKTEEDWSAEIAALNALPDTRSVSVLEGERADEVTKKAKLEVEIQQVQQNVEKWVQEYTDLDSLTARILENATELAGAEKGLAGLPSLPEGYESVASYLEELSLKEQSQSQADEALRNLKIEHAGLIGTAPKHSAEELREALEAKERAFQREEATGQALLRIRAKLEEVVAKRGDVDPMAGLAEAVSRHFKDLTCGRYEGVRLDGAAPVEVNGPLSLETGLLSQGTAGSLALATRMALGELYLDGMDGFLVLDDAFTDMDPGRRLAAAQCLGAFAQNRQVIFFTCHPDHARELEESAGGKAPKML